MKNDCILSTAIVSVVSLDVHVGQCRCRRPFVLMLMCWVKGAEGFSVCQMHKGFLQVGLYCVVLVMLVLEYIHVYYLRCRVLL
jgi:hypothetical protein